MEEENTWKGSIVEAIKKSGPATINTGTIITEEMIRNTIKDLLNSAKDYQEVTAYYYCVGLGRATTTRWDRPYTCEHPKCGFCRDMEKQLKDSCSSFKFPFDTPPIFNDEPIKIPEKLIKVKRGSKFTKKKNRNR